MQPDTKTSLYPGDKKKINFQCGKISSKVAMG